MSVLVDLGLLNIDTEQADFGDVLAAIQSAVDANPDVTFTPASNSQAQSTPAGLFQDDSAPGSIGTLVFTSPADGSSMQNLIVDIPLFDDSIIENSEDFLISLQNSSSPNGLLVSLDADRDAVLTTVADNDFPVNEEPAIGSARPVVSEFVPTEFTPFNILEFATIGLNRMTATLSESVIAQTVNAVSSLDSIFGTNLSNASLFQSLNSNAFQDELNIHTRYYGSDGGSEGFSSGRGYRGTISTDVTDECGRFYIDTIVQGESLAINCLLYTSPSPRDS